MVGLNLPLLAFCEDGTVSRAVPRFNRTKIRSNEDAFMNKDQIKGRMDEAAGKTKKVVGKIAQDEALKQKGRTQEVAGKARASYGDTKEQWKKDDDQR
jgi:uncharacterized protein YjbJ (UPF0337 family)